MHTPRQIRVVGVHRYFPTPEVSRDTADGMYGSTLDSLDPDQVQSDVDYHFEHLYLIEIDVEPSGAEMNWAKITQPNKSLPRSSWQVPWDEQPLDDQKRRWAFFFHFLDLNAPLQTPCGTIRLPAATPLPRHLTGITYCYP